MRIESSTDTFPLEIRTRVIFSGSGESFVDTLVPCARRGTVVPLSMCLACEDSERVEQDPQGGPSLLHCHLPPAFPAGQASGEATGIRVSGASQTPVAALMSSHVICVREDVSIDTLMRLVLEAGISGVPVVDANAFPIGVVSKTDIVRECYENGAPLDTERVLDDAAMVTDDVAMITTSGTVADIMMPIAFTIGEHVPVSQAAALMACEGVHRVPVVSGDGKVTGVLSALDIVRWLAQEDGYLRTGASCAT